MLTVKTRQQRQLTMPPYKPEEKDQFHEFAEAPCDAESVGALSDELNRMLRISFAFLSSKTPASDPRVSLLTPS
jgi:hypothetical protein